HTVLVRDEPADVRLLHNIFHTGGVSAFGQPDAARVATETTAVMIARRQNLRADGRWMVGEQRDQRVRGGAGDDFEPAAVLKFSKRGDESAGVFEICLANRFESAEIHCRQSAIRRLALRTVGL